MSQVLKVTYMTSLQMSINPRALVCMTDRLDMSLTERFERAQLSTLIRCFPLASICINLRPDMRPPFHYALPCVHLLFYPPFISYYSSYISFISTRLLSHLHLFVYPRPYLFVLILSPIPLFYLSISLLILCLNPRPGCIRSSYYLSFIILIRESTCGINISILIIHKSFIFLHIFEES